MHFFNYKGERLFAEDVSIEDIVDEVGTPCYIYSYRTLLRHYRAFDGAFESVPHMVCYSVKANSNIGILRVFASEGSGFDIVSGGELYRALKAGASPDRIVFSGVGKREDEIEFGIRSGILLFNVESPQELRLIDRVAGRLKTRARVSIRVNPDIDPKTHPYISTGLKKNKFGIDVTRAMEEYVYARDHLKNIELIGIDTHIGSQITSLKPFIEALNRTAEMIRKLRAEGIDIRYLDLGGGLGITYDTEQPPHPSKYGEAVIEAADGLDVTLIFEPGRVIVGNAGILVTKVLYIKGTAEKNFVIVDAAMNDLARPSLYNSYHAIKPVKRRGGKTVVADVVGPICESGDFFTQGREIELPQPGDFLAIMSAGGYGFSMSSNYNSRPRAAEVMVRDDTWYVIRERETYDDLIKGEKIPADLGS